MDDAPWQHASHALEAAATSCTPTRTAPARLPATELHHFLRHIEQLHPPEGPESCVVDICCQVVAIDQRNADITALFIWDGTDAMPAPST